MILLRNLAALYGRTGDIEVLKQIKKQRGKYGISITAAITGISESELKAKLNLNKPSQEIAREARRDCGLKTSVWRG